MRSDKPENDQIPYALTIRQPDDPLTWTAQPGPATTLGELALACKAFELKCWVNPTGEVLLVSRLQRIGPLPDSSELARVMWGLGDVPRGTKGGAA
jgi:hypothetical protein